MHTLLEGKSRKAEDVLGWNRQTVELGIDEFRTGIRCINDVSARGKKKVKEIPCGYEENDYERYYPVKTVNGETQSLYRRYRAEADKLPNMTFIGRCGQYIYYDMHQVVANSLTIARRFLSSSISKSTLE